MHNSCAPFCSSLKRLEGHKQPTSCTEKHSPILCSILNPFIFVRVCVCMRSARAPTLHFPALGSTFDLDQGEHWRLL